MNEWARAASELLLNCLWQGIALAALTACVLRLVPGVSAAARYAVWYATLVGLALLPVVSAGLLALAPDDTPRKEMQCGGSPEPPQAPWPALSASQPMDRTDLQPAVPTRIELPDGRWTLWLLGAWAAVALWMLFRLARSYRAIGRLKRDSSLLAGPDADCWTRWFRTCFTARRFDLRSSDRVALPLLAGLVRPAILFPTALVDRLSPDEKYRICLHELAHLRRRDDWTKLGQKLIEAVWFFHPAVRWMGRRLELEREIACDDWVVRVSGSARPYAACLTRLAELTSVSPCPALSTVGNRGQIFRRIEMLLDKNRSRKTRFSRAAFAATLALFLAAVVAVARMTPLVAVQAPPVQEVKPAPQAKPAPAPQAKPSPMPKAGSTEERRAHEEAGRELARRAEQVAEAMRPHQQEIQKLTEEIQRHVQQEIQVNTEQIEELTQKIGAEVRNSIQPHTKEIEKLAAQIAQEHEKKAAGGKPDEAAIRKLEADIRRHETEGIRQAEERIRKLESEIRSYEEKIRPSEEQIRALEEKIREIEVKIREKEREMEELERQMEERMEREAAPPAPPAPPATPAPPAKAAPRSLPAPPAPPASPAPPAHGVRGGIPGGVKGGVPGGVPGVTPEVI